MRFRYPDDPRRVSADYLKSLEDTNAPGTFLAQVKSDGWRRLAYLEGGRWRFYAKRGDKGEEARRQPPPDLVAELAAFGLPDGIALDMEWMGPRNAAVLKGRHSFRVFDLQYVAGRWQGLVPFVQRHANLETIWQATLAKAKAAPERISVVPVVREGLHDFFLRQKEDPLSEGVVVRRASSGLVGGTTAPQDNPSWFKVKYRDIKEPTAF